MINKHFKIFDCFTFYNEIEMLHVRLEELYDFVDYFILCEAPLTFRGKTKNLFYEENKKMFEKYNDKIIHIVDNEIPKNIDSPIIKCPILNSSISLISLNIFVVL